jgi:phosphoribosyl-ATP pyrophosphohydrolase/phosphoribosyl-AMP cyclohydrolase/histidinol dehydrogenase
MTILPLLRTIQPDQITTLQRAPFDAETLATSERLVREVAEGGQSSLRSLAERFDGLTPGAPLLIERPLLEAAADSLPATDRRILKEAAERIRRFADAQRGAFRDFEIKADLSGSTITMGQRVLPLEVVGCYAPGGRHPLPSSVLMTAITARAAGVRTVLVASPRPTAATLAAAAIAGADALLPIGGAHAIAALAYGVVAPRCDAIVGPGNKWVTAAKHCVSSSVSIDMLAGPSEVVILSDAKACPRLIAADLLAQAEHDEDAMAILVTDSRPLIDATNNQLAEQLADLPTGRTARAALSRSFAVLTTSEDESVRVCNRLAPEHLELHAEPASLDRIKDALCSYGTLFLGAGSAEVLGDYGLGPNHTLPTGGTARFAAGLSVYNLLRARTFIRCDTATIPSPLREDLARFARMEGLEAHARAVEARA